MISFPNAKINLGLYVTERREDGYHNLETIFYPLAMNDALEVVPAAKAKLHLSGKAIAGDEEKNLVWKAYQLLKQQYPDIVPPLDIYLHKSIPMGAGLGGGSADGAFMLRLLNDFCKLQLDDDTLAELAMQLGSDCPFFIYNKPCLAYGRGEQLHPIALDLSGYQIVLACPEVHVSTVEAFKTITPKPATFDLAGLHRLAVEDWRGKVQNDFEEAIFLQKPELKTIKEELYAQGAIYASMTGTGSAFYALFPSEAEVVVNMPLPGTIVRTGALSRR